MSSEGQKPDTPAAYEVIAGDLRCWAFLFPLGLPTLGNQMPRVARAIIRGTHLDIQVFMVNMRHNSPLDGLALASRWLERSIALQASTWTGAQATVTRLDDWKEALALVAMEPQRKGQDTIDAMVARIPFPDHLLKIVAGIPHEVPVMHPLKEGEA